MQGLCISALPERSCLISSTVASQLSDFGGAHAMVRTRQWTVSQVTRYPAPFYVTSKEPVCPRVELILKIIIILLIIFLGFIKSKPC